MSDFAKKPYVHVTWVSKLLSGDNSCEWAVWQKAHYGAPKRSRSDLDGWIIKHTALLQKTRARFEKEGLRAFTEDQNKFTLRANTADLGGKPDLVLTGADNFICDIKTGQPKTSDRMQVMMYMYALSRASNRFKGIQFSGMVVYEDYHDFIPAEAIDNTFVDSFASLIRRISSETPARVVPSVRECRFCDFTIDICQARMEAADEIECLTDDF